MLDFKILLSSQHGESSMARECLQMYFMRTPPTNQFLCRAYLCQAQLMAPTDASSTVRVIIYTFY